ncbi:MAG: hypothetical protein KGI84_00730, partial [Elusimicrobia bacterium]|nr:hypothetical protein [Elusimicrobiota bacterium]
MNGSPRKDLRERIANVISTAKTFVQGITGARQAKSGNTAAQYAEGERIFDSAAPSQKDLLSAVFSGTPVLAGLPLLHAAKPEVVAALLGTKDNSSKAGAAAGQSIPAPAADAARVYPAWSWWKTSAQLLARHMVKLLDLPSKHRVGKIWSFTLDQDNTYHPIPETSVLFSRLSRDGDPYYFDKEISTKMGMEFYSYMSLDGVEYIEINAKSAQGAAKIARTLAAIPQVNGVFVSPAVLNEVKKEPAAA